MTEEELELNLDGFKAVDEQTDDLLWREVGIRQDMLTLLAEHHTQDQTHSFWVLHDRSATWGIPGEPQIVALHVQRNLPAATFTFDSEMLPLPSMAQSWLIHRGCPQDAIGMRPDRGTDAADPATLALEQRIMGEGDHFALLHSYTCDDPDEAETVVIRRALDDRSPTPFRVLHEATDPDAWTHTLREGGFATYPEAARWCQDRLSGEDVPLPPVRPTAPATRPAATVGPAPAVRATHRAR